jgi:hypothetical protein
MSANQAIEIRSGMEWSQCLEIRLAIAISHFTNVANCQLMVQGRIVTGQPLV